MKLQYIDGVENILVTGNYTITFLPTAAKLGMDYVPTIHIIIGNLKSVGTCIDKVRPVVTGSSEPVTREFSGRWSRPGQGGIRLNLPVKLSMECIPNFLSITGTWSNL